MRFRLRILAKHGSWAVWDGVASNFHKCLRRISRFAKVPKLTGPLLVFGRH